MSRHSPAGSAFGPETGAKHVLVIGGGASGVLMATHLLSQNPAGLRVTLLEASHILGCGIAYSTTDPDHLLNTRVHNMSAFPEDAHHFEHWLQARPEGAGTDGQSFVSRATYGAYLSDLLAPWTEGPEARRLRCLRRICEKLEETADGVVAQLDGGERIHADMAVLATGHAVPAQDQEGLIDSAWVPLQGLDPEAPVTIIGSGLSMVDQVLSLLRNDHRGQITAISRRGQLPRGHAASKPLAVSEAELPLGQNASRLFAFTRALARRAEAAGGTWRDAIDGLRPHVTRLWQTLPVAERARFLRHAVSWWEVHRHRIPPASEATILAAIATGQLELKRGAFIGAERAEDGGLFALIRPHRGAAAQKVPAGRIIDCRGIRHDPEKHASPVVADLLAKGAARLDPLRLGLDIGTDCQLIGADGRPSARILAIGPVSRAAFWEITAIPDIRVQTATLARRISDALLPVAAG